MRAISTLIVMSLLVHQTACRDPRPRSPVANYARSEVQPQTTREATPEEGAQYAQREQQAGELEKFKGGNASVVSVLVVVLLVVLILYLLGYIR